MFGVNPLRQTGSVVFPALRIPAHEQVLHRGEVRKYLSVILLDDGETVHNAFFDRNFKGEGK